jgi:hypothetical protein
MKHATEDMKHVYKIVVGKPEWKMPLGRPKRRWNYTTVLILILKKLDGGVWTGFIWVRIGTSKGPS